MLCMRTQTEQTNDVILWCVHHNITVKPLNIGHSRLLKCFPLFGGVRYSEGSVCTYFVLSSQRIQLFEGVHYLKVSIEGGFTV